MLAARKKVAVPLKYQARYIPFYNIRQYTQLYVYLIKEYGIVPIAYGCTEIRGQNVLFEDAELFLKNVRDFGLSNAKKTQPPQ